jgi:hypothetical protein
MSTTTQPMSPADHLTHDLASYVRSTCPARTDRGMRTPTGDYMTCAGGHAVDDPHGAPFGTSGWLTWTDPTAPLPSLAAAAMASLEARLAGPSVVRAVAVYETAATHVADLAAVAESGRMTDLDADSLAVAEDLMAGARSRLAAAGMLHLVEAA